MEKNNSSLKHRQEIADRIQHKLDITNQDYKKSIQIIENNQIRETYQQHLRNRGNYSNQLNSTQTTFFNMAGSTSPQFSIQQVQAETNFELGGKLTPHKIQERDLGKNNMIQSKKVLNQSMTSQASGVMKTISHEGSQAKLSAKYKRNQILKEQKQFLREKQMYQAQMQLSMQIEKDQEGGFANQKRLKMNPNDKLHKIS